MRVSHHAAVAGSALGAAILLAMASVAAPRSASDAIPHPGAARPAACAGGATDRAAPDDIGCAADIEVEERNGANWTSTILGYFALGAWLRYTQRTRRAHG